jgi:hypothetical protein
MTKRVLAAANQPAHFKSWQPFQYTTEEFRYNDKAVQQK